jgi:aryl-alcohol dehydrogenase-like predicted oxidoreductase
VHPITTLQSEYSLFERGVEREVLPACRALGVGFVPFAPLGRGFLAGAARRAEEYQQGDFRGVLPRFQAEHFDHNRALAESLARLAARLGLSAAQLALAWLLAQGPDIVPIPGARQRRHLEDNVAAAAVRLAACDLMALEEMFPRGAAAGERYRDADFGYVER